jgi:hypothetical protein
VRVRDCKQTKYVPTPPPDTTIDALTLVLFVPGYRESVVQGGSLRMECVANKGNGCVYCHRTPRSWPLRWSSSRPATRRSWCRVAVCARKVLHTKGICILTATGHGDRRPHASLVRARLPGERGAGWQSAHGKRCKQRKWVCVLPPDTTVVALTLVLFEACNPEIVVQGGSLRMESVANEWNGHAYCHRAPRPHPGPH